MGGICTLRIYPILECNYWLLYKTSQDSVYRVCVCMYACTCAVRGMRSNHLLSLPQVTHPYTHSHGIHKNKKASKSRTDLCGLFQPQNPITKHEQTLVCFENNASLWSENQSSFGKNPCLLFGKCRGRDSQDHCNGNDTLHCMRNRVELQGGARWSRSQHVMSRWVGWRHTLD